MVDIVSLGLYVLIGRRDNLVSILSFFSYVCIALPHVIHQYSVRAR